MSPRPTSVTAVAVINIILGVLCSCSSLSMTATPAIMSAYQQSMTPMMKQVKQQFEADKRREIARLRAERQQATTAEERQQIDEKIKTWQAMKTPDMRKFFGLFTAPQVATFYVVTGIIGCLLNLLLLIAGIGLFPLAEWARKLSIAASVMGIIFTLTSNAFNVFVITPTMAPSLQAMMTEIQKMSPPGQPPSPGTNMGAMMQVWTALWSGIYCLLLCGWLVAVIVILSNRRVRDTFRAAAARPRHNSRM
ncbi:MAG: hypothetical protein NZT92_01025 [Abditibacteriales bacterium]|nr:hypothetical protein [Abditibacteriales bacterium]MDW8364383.1 hypothetical protein [Abditibacteriales bacterium]